MVHSVKIRSRVFHISNHVILIVSAIIMLIPFLWMVSSSLLNENEMFQIPPVWIPKPPRFQNYSEAWNALPFTLFLRNTLVITIGRLLPLLFSCTVTAFGFARLKGRGKNTLFMIMLATMMLPYQVTMIPTYIFFAKINWVNTFKPFIVPSFFGMPFFIFMMRQFFLTLPSEMDEAARIDGASTFQIFTKIYLPLSKAAMAAMAVFIFMFSWNDFIMPLIYLHKVEQMPLALGIQLFRSYGEYFTRWDYIMACSVAMSIPPLAVFFFSQKYFIKGVALTGLKG